MGFVKFLMFRQRNSDIQPIIQQLIILNHPHRRGLLLTILFDQHE